MTYREALSWERYRNKHGGLNPGRQIELAIAKVALMFSSAHLKKKNGDEFSINDFLVYPVEIKESYASPEEVFALLTGIAAEGKASGK